MQGLEGVFAPNEAHFVKYEDFLSFFILGGCYIYATDYELYSRRIHQ